MTTVTTSNGEAQRFFGRGEIRSEKGGERVTYSEEGDPVTLFAGERSFLMKREGNARIRLCFTEGERTGGAFSYGEFSGELAVLTRRYTKRQEGNAFFITLEYGLVFPTHTQEFQLEITIDYSEEK